MIISSKSFHITPNNPEIKAISKYCAECSLLMGDFNLSHRTKEDQMKIVDLCQDTKINSLREITRAISNNQLDYVLIDKEFAKMCFTTSYNNFISDHNSTIVRVALNGNQFTDEFKERITFDKESHLKEKEMEHDLARSNTSSEEDSSIGSIESRMSDGAENYDQDIQTFSRKFNNLDLTNCWLNSCLQLILASIDHSESRENFTSELGLELMRLHESDTDFSLDSTNVKHIIVTAEDTRIATRMSELSAEIHDQFQLEHRMHDVENLRLNLISGQQCVRDFFLCLNENILSWPDVYFKFGFKITHSTKCTSCQHIYQSETQQTYVELQVPSDESNLNDYVEDFFNRCTTVGRFCENECQKIVPAEKNSKVTNASETEFITVILTRAMETLDGYQLNKNRVNITNDVFIR